MPKYRLLCVDCNEESEAFHSIKESPTFKCSSCGSDLKKLIGSPSVHLKGDSWTGKLLKEKDLRQKKSTYLDRKQRVEHKLDKVVPNVDGEVVSSWKEAKSLAKSKGYDTSSYDKFGKK